MTLLLSAPISMTEIIIGKFIGLMAFLLLIILLVLAIMGLQEWRKKANEYSRS
jgi:ABC-type Na+ efflux pump permease subunit